MSGRPYKVGNVSGDRVLQRLPGTGVFIDGKDGSRWTFPEHADDDDTVNEYAGYSETPNGEVICVCSGVPDEDDTYCVSVMQRIDWDGIRSIPTRKIK